MDEEKSPSIETSQIENAHRGLKARHVRLIAVSSSIGSAVFITIGNPLTSGGPLALLIGIFFWSTVVAAISNCLVETTTLLPVDGGFITLTSRFLGPNFGMALGWNYWITQAALVCYEITAVNVIVAYWAESLHPAILISVCLVLLAGLNLWSVRFYGEAEFWLSIGKILTIFALFFYTFITMLGGNPLGDRYGFRYWRIPGPFATDDATSRFLGIWDTVVWACFAIVGPDYLSLIGGEVVSPRRVLPKSFNTIIFRLFVFYFLGAVCIGIVCPSDSEQLLGAIEDGSGTAAQSPYTISMNRLRIPVLPDLLNAMILLSVFSTLNSFLYATSRSLFGLAQSGHAPKIFTWTNRNGVPWTAVTFSLLVGCLSYLEVSSGTYVVLNYWISLVTSTQLVTWTVVSVVYLRFRKAMKAQGIESRNFLPYKARFQPFAVYWALFWSPIAFIFNGYSVFLKGNWDIATFFFNYGSIFIFVVLLSGYTTYLFIKKKGNVAAANQDELGGKMDKFLSYTGIIPLDQVDLHTGIEEMEAFTKADNERVEKETGGRRPNFLVRFLETFF